MFLSQPTTGIAYSGDSREKILVEWSDGEGQKVKQRNTSTTIPIRHSRIPIKPSPINLTKESNQMDNLKEIIKAWTNGKTIQIKPKNGSLWIDKQSYEECVKSGNDVLFCYEWYDYRIKPEEVVRYVLADHFEEALMRDKMTTAYQPMLHKHPLNITGNIKLTFIDNVLTKAEVV